MATGDDDAGRGREAKQPHEIPRRGWRDILLRTKDQIRKDNIGIVSAGVAFYGFLSFFPALTALVSIYGLVADPSDVARTVDSLQGALPDEALTLIEDELQRVASGQSGALGVGAIAGLALALWSAAKGVKALMTALNIAYDEAEKRGFIRLNAAALFLMLAALAVGILSLAVIVFVPVLLRAISAPGWILRGIDLLRWPVLVAALASVIALLYRYGPSRREPRWSWVNPGSGLATVLWLGASIAFSIYVTNFGNYDKVYGTFGAVVILMVWLFLSAYVVLLGAELNAELEHQTRRDTTIDGDKPMGSRGAQMADTLGEPR